VPDAHEAHADSAVAPVALEAVPGGQDVHADAPASEYVPGLVKEVGR
jgi:hypothetical protein